MAGLSPAGPCRMTLSRPASLGATQGATQPHLHAQATLCSGTPLVRRRRAGNDDSQCPQMQPWLHGQLFGGAPYAAGPEGRARRQVEYWQHSRTTNAIESTFATVRHRYYTHARLRLATYLLWLGIQADRGR
jgi:hypothetical protein